MPGIAPQCVEMFRNAPIGPALMTTDITGGQGATAGSAGSSGTVDDPPDGTESTLAPTTEPQRDATAGPERPSGGASTSGGDGLSPVVIGAGAAVAAVAIAGGAIAIWGGGSGAGSAVATGATGAAPSGATVTWRAADGTAGRG